MKTEEWVALGDGFLFSWQPSAPHIECSDPAILAAVKDRLDGRPIKVTPTSSPVKAVVSDSEAVLAALYDVAAVDAVSAGAPWPKLPPDAIA